MAFFFFDFIWSLIFELAPLGAVFVLASQAAFRLWLAVQKASLPELYDGAADQPSRTVRVFRIIAIFSLLAVMVVAVSFLVFKDALQALLVLSTIPVFLALSISLWATALFVNDICGVGQHNVHRTLTGGFIVRNADQVSCWKRALRIVGVLVTALIVHGGLVGEWRTFSAIPAIAFSYYIFRRSLLNRISVRRIVIGFVCWLVAIVGLAVFGAWYEHRHRPRQEPYSMALLPLYQFMGLQGSLVPVLPALLFAICLRMDYKFFQNKAGEEGGMPDLLEVQTHIAPSPEFGEGVVIPLKAPKGFPKVYFKTALSTWAVLHAVLLAVFSENGFARVTARNLVMEFPIILIVLVIQAAIRRELRSLWRYREDWKIKTVPGGIELP